jgi:uncharacterized membrane protein YcaP (DUF421 family)
MELFIPNIGQVLTIIIRTVVIFFFTFFMLRLLGKKRLSQFGIIDLLLIISLGSAVGDVMIYSENTTSMIASLIAIATVGIFIKVYDELVDRFPHIQNFFEGRPVIIVRNGITNKTVLHKENITEEQLLSSLREKGFHKVDDVKKAILEPDGQISVKENKQPTQ